MLHVFPQVYLPTLDSFAPLSGFWHSKHSFSGGGALVEASGYVEEFCESVEHGLIESEFRHMPCLAGRRGLVLNTFAVPSPSA